MLKKWRLENNLSVSQAAKKLGFPRSKYYRYETGKQFPDDFDHAVITVLTKLTLTPPVKSKTITPLDIELIPLHNLLSLTPEPSRQTIYNWKTGRSKPGPAHRQQLEKLIEKRLDNRVGDSLE